MRSRVSHHDDVFKMITWSKVSFQLLAFVQICSEQTLVRLPMIVFAFSTTCIRCRQHLVHDRTCIFWGYSANRNTSSSHGQMPEFISRST